MKRIYKDAILILMPGGRNYKNLRNLAYESLLNLSTEDGILASSKSEIYGCVFGRDSAITILKIIKSLSSSHFSSIQRNTLIEICRRAMLKLVLLQGKSFNLENGEEPGKFIHEYRKENFERFLKKNPPWYVSSEGLKNYDSIDSTPLSLIAIYKFYELTKDKIFLSKVLSSVETGLGWIIAHSDKDNDNLVEYEFNKKRKFGGLIVQSWTDSRESLKGKNGEFPLYPIAPVEVQGYVWFALKLWADFYKDQNPNLSRILLRLSRKLKKEFNKRFIFQDLSGNYFLAQALDGNKRQIKTVTGNPLLLLWATYKNGKNKECIIYKKYIKYIVKRSFKRDLFDGKAGIRTMSRKAENYNPNQDSYHNGSFWPKLNGMIYGGLLNWEFNKEALKLKKASLRPIKYFNSPIELYVRSKEGDYLEYKNSFGQTGCRNQAWTAGVLLYLTS